MLDIIQVENRSRATAGARQAAKLDKRNPLTLLLVARCWRKIAFRMPSSHSQRRAYRNPENAEAYMSLA
jgi:hypothetical protein